MKIVSYILKNCKHDFWRRFFLFVLVIIVFVLFIDYLSRLFCAPIKLREVAFDNYLRTLIAIAALIIALSLVVVYSLFNSNVEYQKRRIADKFEQLNKKLIRNTSKIEGQRKEKANDENAIAFSMEYNINFFSIILEYTTPLVKMNAIAFFNSLDQQNISPNIRESLNKYYMHLVSTEDGGQSRIYMKDLKNLIEKWGGPSNTEAI